jgi:hypothetical protein
MRNRFLIIIVAVAVIAMAVPVAEAAAGTNGAHHETVTLGYHEGLLAAMKGGGCHYVFNWLPVVQLRNGIPDSQVSGLKEGFPLALPDGCEKGPSKEVVRQARAALLLLEKGEAAVANGTDRESLEAELGRLTSTNNANIRRAKLAEAEATRLAVELGNLRAEKAAAKAPDWRAALVGFGAGAFFLFVAWSTWFRGLKKRADIVYKKLRVLDPDSGQIMTYDSTTVITYGCRGCSARDLAGKEETLLSHERRIHAANRQHRSPVPLVPPKKRGRVA